MIPPTGGITLPDELRAALDARDRQWESALADVEATLGVRQPRPPLQPEMVSAWARRLPRYDADLERDYEALATERDDLASQVEDLIARAHALEARLTQLEANLPPGDA